MVDRCLIGAVCLAALASLTSCRRQDIRTCRIEAPGLKNEACVEVITRAFQRYAAQPNMEGAVKTSEIKYDVKTRTITIEYDSMKTAMKNLEHIVAAAGFDANEVPARKEAAEQLPPECR